MHVRDAVEADAEVMAALANQPEDVMRNLVHDRTVRVAVDEAAEESDRKSEAESSDTDSETEHSDADPEMERSDAEPQADNLRGVISFDARENVIHVTQLAGDPEIVGELLDEPLRFARGEGMAVEALIGADASERRDAVERAGFTEQGAGPMFDGERTVRYRADPGSTV